MKNFTFKEDDRVLILGATGFIGKRLVKELAGKNVKMRLLARTPSKAAGIVPEGADAEIVQGDLTKKTSMEDALKGIHSAYYLVHSMGGKSLLKNIEFAEKDKGAAHNFTSAADKEGLKRVFTLEDWARQEKNFQNI